MDYKTSGIDIEEGYKSVELMKKHIAKTMRPGYLEESVDSQVHFPWRNSKIWKNLHWFPEQTDAEPRLR